MQTATRPYRRSARTENPVQQLESPTSSAIPREYRGGRHPQHHRLRALRAPRWRTVAVATLGIATLATLGMVASRTDDTNERGRSGIRALDSRTDTSEASESQSAIVEGAPPTRDGDRPVLGYGATAPAVEALQMRLLQLGFDPGGVDGRYGPRTVDAVTAFQTSVEIGADGIVGPQTWAALDAAEPPG